jgi:hypothetical protein
MKPAARGLGEDEVLFLESSIKSASPFCLARVDRLVSENLNDLVTLDAYGGDAPAHLGRRQHPVRDRE